jgi:SHS2 domain-containing protein
MKTERFRFLDDLTSDVMFEAYGRTIEELLQNAALAMFSVICDIERVEPKEELTFEVSAEDETSLLYRWLSEALTRSEIEELFLSEFVVESLQSEDGPRIRARARGEPASPEKGDTVVKAVTYYGLGVKKDSRGYRATVSLDI